MATAKRRLLRGTALLAAAASTLLVGVGLAGSANAAVVSYLTATPSSVTLDLSGVNTAQVNVGLDSNCINALGAPGKNSPTYSVLVGTYDTTIVTVTGTSSSYKCSNAGATFTFTGMACGTANVPFDPAVANAGGQDPGGLQNKLGGTSVDVTVIDSLSLDPNCGGQINNPPPGGRPAAPAVANHYLNFVVDSSYIASCKHTVGGGSNWRGIVISDVAAWMPLPESIKDDTSVFPNDWDWYSFVYSAVNAICGGTSLPPLP